MLLYCHTFLPAWTQACPYTRLFITPVNEYSYWIETHDRQPTIPTWPYKFHHIHSPVEEILASEYWPSLPLGLPPELLIRKAGSRSCLASPLGGDPLAGAAGIEGPRGVTNPFPTSSSSSSTRSLLITLASDSSRVAALVRCPSRGNCFPHMFLNGVSSKFYETSGKFRVRLD